ncbi:hypothetical protein Clacol_001897 [Clathrus columnatus]|uniref:Uncharacterized protein n=1 Tax=Clathrus columnatus TaxID=1419009 RepID=A0AAV5A2M8_9AGAM|nr:hypothetical protein Clacol_001897 [Clathrus columnatus]
MPQRAPPGLHNILPPLPPPQSPETFEDVEYTRAVLSSQDMPGVNDIARTLKDWTEQQMKQMWQQIEQRIERMDQQIERMDQQISGMAQSIYIIGRYVERLEHRVTAMDEQE